VIQKPTSVENDFLQLLSLSMVIPKEERDPACLRPVNIEHERADLDKGTGALQGVPGGAST
jgi:hypothetical protein